MPPRSSNPKRLLRALAGALTLSALGVLAPATASAHFILEAPASWMSQDSLGSPQKLGPCGDEGGGTATGTVTAFKPGETITITVEEEVFHPGHYRIALGVNGPADLPAEPLVTAGATPCDTAAVESPAVFPVLADGVLDHTVAFTGPQSVQVTLPTDVTCTNCTLQIIEFMSDHGLNVPGGCFYHHCADISIGAAAPADGGGGSTASGSGGAGTSTSSGCSVTGPHGGAWAPAPLGGLFVVAALLRLRRRSTARSTATARPVRRPLPPKP